MIEKETVGEKQLLVNFTSLKNFRNSEKLKKVALTFIASQLSESEIAGLAVLFEKLDKNGDGVLTFEEIKAGYIYNMFKFSNFIITLYRFKWIK